MITAPGNYKIWLFFFYTAKVKRRHKIYGGKNSALYKKTNRKNNRAVYHAVSYL